MRGFTQGSAFLRVLRYNLFAGCLALVLIVTFAVSPRANAAPTTLAPNDIVVVTANSDTTWSTTACTDSAPGGSNSNAIDFLLRKDIGAGTVFKVTDNAWTGSALATSEGRITYTAPTDLPAGTVIRYSDCLYNQGNSDWTRSTPLAGFDPAIAGDTVLIYQGTEAAPNFIYGFGFRSNSWITSGTPSSNNSRIPAALSSASPTAYTAPGTTSGPRNYQYTGSTIGIYASSFLSGLKSAANWAGTGGASTGVTFGPISTVFDATRPTFTSVARLSPTAAITNASSVTFCVTTSEPVQALSSSNFTTTTTGTISYASISVANISGSEYNVTLNGLSGEGTVALASYTGSMINTHGNPAIDQTFVSPSFVRDTTAPVVTVTPVVTNTTSPSLSGTIDDSSASVSVLVNGVVYAATVSGNSWHLAAGVISPALADGTYSVVATATDLAGNVATDTTSNELTIDTVAPTPIVSRAAGQASLTNIDHFEYTITFNKPINPSTFLATDIILAGTTATVTSFVQTSPTSWSIIVSGAASGDTVTPTLSASAIQDTIGNASTASVGPASSVVYDSTAPIATMTPMSTTISSPQLSGIVDDLNASISIVINGFIYQARNTAEVWTLDAGTISPVLQPGSYDVRIVTLDAAGNMGSFVITGGLIVSATPSSSTSHTIPRAPNTGVKRIVAGQVVITAVVALVILLGIARIVQSLE